MSDAFVDLYKFLCESTLEQLKCIQEKEEFPSLRSCFVNDWISKLTLWKEELERDPTDKSNMENRADQIIELQCNLLSSQYE